MLNLQYHIFLDTNVLPIYIWFIYNSNTNRYGKKLFVHILWKTWIIVYKVPRMSTSNAMLHEKWNSYHRYFRCQIENVTARTNWNYCMYLKDDGVFAELCKCILSTMHKYFSSISRLYNETIDFVNFKFHIRPFDNWEICSESFYC